MASLSPKRFVLAVRAKVGKSSAALCTRLSARTEKPQNAAICSYNAA